MLNLPWDELRKAICQLHEIIGDNDRGLYELSNFASEPTLPQKPQCGSMFWDIAFGYLPILTAVNAGRLPAQFRQLFQDWTWSCAVRLCPPCHDLAQHLCKFFHFTPSDGFR
ncbi:hypothetical protein B0H14DRAFT_3146472, partial [Mycena olivaceomarginata]